MKKKYMMIRWELDLARRRWEEANNGIYESQTLQRSS